MLELGNLSEKGLVPKCVCLSLYIYTSGLISQNIAVCYDCHNFVGMSHFTVKLGTLSYWHWKRHHYWWYRSHIALLCFETVSFSLIFFLAYIITTLIQDLYEICGGKNGTGTGFSVINSVLLLVSFHKCHILIYVGTIPQIPHIHSSITDAILS
jgi:hypothetical protein